MVDSLTTCIGIKKVLVLKIVMLIITITILIIASTIKMKWKVIPIVLIFVIIKVLNNNNTTYSSDSPSVNTIDLVTRQLHSLWSINKHFVLLLNHVYFVCFIIQYAYDLIMILAPKLYLPHIIMAQQ